MWQRAGESSPGRQWRLNRYLSRRARGFEIARRVVPCPVRNSPYSRDCSSRAGCCRQYGAVLSDLLWAAFGINRPSGDRSRFATPGNCRAVNVRWLTESGTVHIPMSPQRSALSRDVRLRHAITSSVACRGCGLRCRSQSDRGGPPFRGGRRAQSKRLGVLNRAEGWHSRRVYGRGGSQRRY